MEKNEKGYPCFRVSKAVGFVPTFNNSTGGANNGEMNGNGSSNGNGCTNSETNHSCGGNGTCLDEMNLAYVYAPDQKFRMLYSAEDSLKHGTLFEELYKPKEVYGREW